jgi:hypothetical protein
MMGPLTALLGRRASRSPEAEGEAGSCAGDDPAGLGFSIPVAAATVLAALMTAALTGLAGTAVGLAATREVTPTLGGMVALSGRAPVRDTTRVKVKGTSVLLQESC